MSGSGEAASRAVRSIAPTIRAPCVSISSRRFAQTSAIEVSTVLNAGMPCRGSSGKYVPA